MGTEGKRWYKKAEENVKKRVTTNENLVRRMTERVEVDELLDLARQAQERRVHYIREVPSQRLHVITRLRRTVEGRPVVLGRLY